MTLTTSEKNDMSQLVRAPKTMSHTDGDSGDRRFDIRETEARFLPKSSKLAGPSYTALPESAGPHQKQGPSLRNTVVDLGSPTPQQPNPVHSRIGVAPLIVNPCVVDPKRIIIRRRKARMRSSRIKATRAPPTSTL